MSGSFGLINERVVKTLILFVMRRIPEPVTLDVLTELSLCDKGISYFEVTECIEMLVETEHIRYDNGKYSLTGKGERNGEILEENLPHSVMTRAEAAVAHVRAAIKRNEMIKTHWCAKEDGGYQVALSLSDGIGDIIKMELFAANEQQASFMETGFRKRAEKIYQVIIEMLLK